MALTYDADRLRDALTTAEGRRATPYRDPAGVLTIGVGRNLDAVGLRSDEIDLLLTNDIQDRVDHLPTYLPWVQHLDVVRTTALLEIAFALGMRGLLQFERMLGALQRGDWEQAATELLNSTAAQQWARTRTGRLAAMLRTGTWPQDLPPR